MLQVTSRVGGANAAFSPEPEAERGRQPFKGWDFFGGADSRQWSGLTQQKQRMTSLRRAFRQRLPTVRARLPAYR